MTFQAYLDTIKAKTGKAPEDFLALAEEKGFLQDGVKTGQIVAWLADDFGLGRGHAMALVDTFKSATQPKQTRDQRIARLFSGDKARWRTPYDELLAKISAFGPGVAQAPTDTYISILRRAKKFAIVAWDREQDFDTLDETAVVDFFNTYVDHGREDIP